MSRRSREEGWNDGRAYGWYVEVDGRIVAALVGCRPAEAGCDSYRVVPLTSDPGEAARLYGDELWARPGRVVFRNRWLGVAVRRAAPVDRAGAILRETGRLIVRGLYLRRPSVWRRLVGLLGRVRPAVASGGLRSLVSVR